MTAPPMPPGSPKTTAAARPIHLGYSLSSEEHGPLELLDLARRAEQAGFVYASLSDHFHPWIEAQGNSPFAWSVLGGIAAVTDALVVGTGVTCPTIRYHPAIVAQAAATVARMLPGRFFLGVGSGEALNEHITGQRWPPTDIRLEMLEEAIGIIRALWTGENVDHHGRHFTVENARLSTRPAEPPPVVVAAAGPHAAALAGRAGDGLMNFTADRAIVETFATTGGEEGAGRPRYLQVNVCFDEDKAQARRTAFRVCPTVALKGNLNVELPTPTHFEEAIAMVDEAAVAEVITCGPDPERHLAALQAGIDAGYDHLHVYQVGSKQEPFFRFYAEEIIPRLARKVTVARN
jgi:coenzyme F420-dependent glucose-6-phosphate dehydrogenase